MSASVAFLRRLAFPSLGVSAGMLILAFSAHSAQAGTSVGPDVTVLELFDIANNGASGGVRGYSIGTNSCNVGTTPVNWCDNNGGCGAGTTDEDHPVIAQNLYRVKDGRMTQIGMSWLKHGFLSTNSFDARCGSCVGPPLGSSQLGVGCTDIYDSGLNGSRPLGRRSEVNATNGEFPFPFGGGGASAAPSDQRVKVLETDVDPALNAGARYFAEGQYVTADDAVAGNGLNNASWEEVTVSGASFNLSLVGGTIREQSALYAWQVVDPTVELVNADLASTPVERFEVARKVTNPSSGVWHYEYIVRNMNSDRSAQAFTLTFPVATTITNTGTHQVNHHSNEPYSTTAWVSTVGASSVSWATDTFGTNNNANALRWGTAFSYWFDATSPPDFLAHTLTLFKPGSPTEINFAFGELFGDGFETGDVSAWTTCVGLGCPP